MASLEQRGDRFRVVFRFGGQRFSRALKTRSEADATAMLARLEDNLRRVELGTLQVPDHADVLTFLLSDGQMLSRPRPPAMRSLGQLLDAYKESIPAGSMEGTTTSCIGVHIAHLKRIMGQHTPLQEIRLEEMQAYVNKRVTEQGLRGRLVGAVTVKKELSTLKAAWSWGLNADKLQRPLPSRGLKYPKSSEKLLFMTFGDAQKRLARGGLTPAQEADLWDSVFLSLSEIDELLKEVKLRSTTPCIYPMMVFAAHTGARRSEILRCEVDDIDFGLNMVTIHEKKRVRGRLTTRCVPMSALLGSVLREWLSTHPGQGRCFYTAEELKGCADTPLTPKETDYQFKKVVAGTKWAKLRGWHVFRHSFCSNCAAKGIDQRLINAWVGHQTEEMVRRYRHLVPNQEHSALQSVFGPA